MERDNLKRLLKGQSCDTCGYAWERVNADATYEIIGCTHAGEVEVHAIRGAGQASHPSYSRKLPRDRTCERWVGVKTYLASLGHK